MDIQKILIADDDRTLRKGLLFEFQELSFQVIEASTSTEAIDLIDRIAFDLVITDLKIPEIADGMRIVEEAKKHHAGSMVMVITGYGSIDLAVQAMQAGADDFVTKDASFDEIKLKAEKLLQMQRLNSERIRIQEENRILRDTLEEKYRFKNIIGHSKIFQDTLKLVGKVAEDGYCTVLLHGESGTGKELIARAIHYNSPRRDKRYVIVNIAAVPDTLLESELFGHVKGAFTDAVKERTGKLTLADGGTVFLDEIGDISLNLQTKLLRVLQEKSFEPLGSNETIQVDVRIIAASNQDLKQKIKENIFREDLYYRLNVVPITLPPLRERKEDIPLLTEHFLELLSQGRGKKLVLDPGIIEYFYKYDWPGNVRELENIVEQLVVLASDPVIKVKDLPNQFFNVQDHQSIQADPKKMKFSEARTEILTYFEKRYIQAALEDHGWNITKTAKTIGISREGLHRMMKKYGIKNF